MVPVGRHRRHRGRPGHCRGRRHDLHQGRIICSREVKRRRPRAKAESSWLFWPASPPVDELKMPKASGRASSRHIAQNDIESRPDNSLVLSAVVPIALGSSDHAVFIL